MPQSIAHRTQASDHPIDLVGLGGKRSTVYPRAPMRDEHLPDLVQGEAGRAAQ